jgi:hypothetical protein
VPAGAPAAGSPSGYQIQFVPVRSGAPPSCAGAPIHDARQPVNAVSNQAVPLHGDHRPCASATRTRQVYRVAGLSADLDPVRGLPLAALGRVEQPAQPGPGRRDRDRVRRVLGLQVRHAQPGVGVRRRRRRDQQHAGGQQRP